ncbi:MAG: HAD family hydrolase [Lachnospiraceae bacterium]|nr:HAD family hydrolase [Lachnospiraceae bacterium]MBQ5484305.1 HAD family hydrolase [Lachnospiraceae bacterium]
MYTAAIFDMDGTILDTLDDLTDAMNYALAQTGHRHNYSSDLVRRFFGSGVTVAIQRALATESGFDLDRLEDIGDPTITMKEPLPWTEEEVARIQAIYKPYYDSHCAIHTGPYKGINEMISALKKAGIKTAVVSNKPDSAVQSLCQVHFNGIFDFALGEKKGLRRKPAPDMVDTCIRALDVDPKDCVYIGDSEVDIATAQSSHIPCISVDWGFRSHHYLENVKADVIASTAEDVAKLIME